MRLNRNSDLKPGRREFMKVAMAGAVGGSTSLSHVLTGKAKVNKPSPGIKLSVQLHSNPSDEDLAAIIAVVTAAVAPAPEGPKPPRDGWGLDTSSGRGASPNVPWTYPNVSNLRW